MSKNQLKNFNTHYYLQIKVCCFGRDWKVQKGKIFEIKQKKLNVLLNKMMYYWVYSPRKKG